MRLDPATFCLLRDLVYQRTGMKFEDKKRQFVESRVAERLLVVGADNPRDYYRYLRYEDLDGNESQELVESLTTNETHFFREFPQLQWFADEALPRIAEAKRAAGNYTLNIWSAACSTGDEPYTLAIILRECLDDFDKWQIRILATDIDRKVLDVARRGVYRPRAVKEVPSAYMSYFRTVGREYHLCQDIKSMVTLKQLNLMDCGGTRCRFGFDFVFCRNVLIYFDDTSCQHVLSSLHDALAPGGFIFLGYSESIARTKTSFETVRIGDTLAYRRPPAKHIRART